jgi:hypothetical protein
MSNVIIDGDLTSPVAIGTSNKSYPIKANYDVYLESQEYAVHFDAYEDPELSGTFVSRSAVSSMGGGILKYTDTHLLNASSYEEVEMITEAVTFPAIILDRARYIELASLGYERGNSHVWYTYQFKKSADNLMVRPSFTMNVKIQKTKKLKGSGGPSPTSSRTIQMGRAKITLHGISREDEAPKDEPFKITKPRRLQIEALQEKHRFENRLTLEGFKSTYVDETNPWIRAPDRVASRGSTIDQLTAPYTSGSIEVDHVSENTTPNSEKYMGLIGQKTFIPKPKEIQHFMGKYYFETSYLTEYK